MSEYKISTEEVHEYNQAGEYRRWCIDCGLDEYWYRHKEKHNFIAGYDELYEYCTDCGALESNKIHGRGVGNE